MKGRDDATNTGPDGRTVLPRKEGGRTHAEVKAESPPGENHGPRQKPQKTRGKSKTSHQAPINLGWGGKGKRRKGGIWRHKSRGFSQEFKGEFHWQIRPVG